MYKILLKIKRRIWSKIVYNTKETKLYPYLYFSFWFSLFSSKRSLSSNQNLYFTARPNSGAGIGHQIANWIAGYWFANQFGLSFAHSYFSSIEWENFLGFGENEVKVDELFQLGFRKVLLPLFADNIDSEVERIQSIINSYQGRRIIFICEQDQFYKNQYGVIDDIRRKFYTASSRKDDKLLYSKENFNIAIHIRRGDIISGQRNGNPNLLMRWQNNDYFVNVLINVLKTFKPVQNVAIYIFSQEEKSNFDDFEQFHNVHYCLEMGARESFLHMVNADLLITSKSSFSYKPALLNKGIKVCPRDFWHGYPESADWILADKDGNLELNKISANL